MKYHGTDIDICLGDRIEYRKIFGGKLLLGGKFPGTVAYVPGQSQKNSELEYGDVKHWAMVLDGEEDSPIIWPYFPEDGWVSKRIQFVSRGRDFSNSIRPDEMVFGDQPEDEGG